MSLKGNQIFNKIRFFFVSVVMQQNPNYVKFIFQCLTSVTKTFKPILRRIVNKHTPLEICTGIFPA
jgi:hypothetical protein